METVGILTAGVIIGIALAKLHYQDRNNFLDRALRGDGTPGPRALRSAKGKRKPKVGDDEAAYLSEVEELKHKPIGSAS